MSFLTKPGFYAAVGTLLAIIGVEVVPMALFHHLAEAAGALSAIAGIVVGIVRNE